LVTPTVIYPALRGVLSTEKDGLNENRNLAPFTWSFNNFGANFEKWYNDHVPFRNSFIKLYQQWQSKIKFGEDENYFKLVSLIDGNQVLYGNNGWLFSVNRNELGQYDYDYLREYGQTLALAQQKIQSLGKQIIFQFCPTGLRVYPEFVPQKAMQYAVDGLTDYLVRYLWSNFPELKISYGLDNLLSGKKDYEVWYKADTHPNLAGGYFLWQNIQNLLGIEQTPINELNPQQISVKNRAMYANDIASMAGEPFIFDNIDYILNYKPEIETYINGTLFNNNQEPVSIHVNFTAESNSPNNQSLLFVGDSFRAIQNFYATKDFAKTQNIHVNDFLNAPDRQGIGYDNAEAITEMLNDADVIIIEVAHSIMSQHANLLNACRKIIQLLS
jgi:hypothetical protein